MRRRTGKPRLGMMTAAVALSAISTVVTDADDICGDLDGNGIVEKVDMGILLAAFGWADGDPWYNPQADIDADGDVDQTDLAWFMINFGCPYWIDCIPCEPRGSGTIDLDLVEVDNSNVQPGDDDYAPNFGGGVTHFTFDLVVTISPDNDWTTQSSLVHLTSDEVVFFNHEFGGDYPPMEALWQYFPALEFDSFYAVPPDFNEMIRFAFVESTSSTAEAVWFNDYRHADDVSTVQRLTIVIAEDSGIVPAAVPSNCADGYVVLAEIATDATSAATGADFLPREFLIVDLGHECPGDVDRDGDVDQSDLGILLAAWNRPTDDPLYDQRADFDCDGDVDQADLGALLASFGADC
ncbi:MAG: dockerin type I domain-containing protein [Phycisphaerales bacterium JB038]